MLSLGKKWNIPSHCGFASVFQIVEIDLHRLPADVGCEEPEAVELGDVVFVAGLEVEGRGFVAKDNFDLPVAVTAGRVVAEFEIKRMTRRQNGGGFDTALVSVTGCADG